jgi:hypothetical protein
MVTVLFFGLPARRRFAWLISGYQAGWWDFGVRCLEGLILLGEKI